jgi:hypothetical protein
MIGVLVRVKGGFGPINIRIVAIVLIAVPVSLSGISENSLLAAIACYLPDFEARSHTRNSRKRSSASYCAAAGDGPGLPTVPLSTLVDLPCFSRSRAPVSASVIM